MSDATTSNDPQIYDSVADKYDNVLAAPGTKIIYWMLDRFFSTSFSNDLKGFSVLELACGTGDCARKAQVLGATKLVGVDVSSEMINIAHEIEKGMGVTGIDYYVADCSKPIEALKGEEGTFDLVLGNWLLNYATSFDEIVGMWSNIALYLKPGGKFIGAFTGFNPNAKGLTTGKYGARGKVTEHIADGKGVRVGLTFATEPPVEFDVFILEKQMYIDAAEKVGLGEIDFQAPSFECLPAGESKEFWNDEMESPSNIMFVVTRPQ
jgi:ubiquinone/menaquinone biosynthesis C-methylase UbiE